MTTTNGAKQGDYQNRIGRAVHRLRTCLGYRETDGDLWLGPTLHEIEDEHAQITAAARALILEIQQRDGEGNVLPASTYATLARLVGARVRP